MQRWRRGRKRQYPAALLPPLCFSPHAVPLFFTESPSFSSSPLVCSLPPPQPQSFLTRCVISHFILVSPPHVSFLASRERGGGGVEDSTHLLSLFTLIPSPNILYSTLTLLHLPSEYTATPLDDVIRISAFAPAFLSARIAISLGSRFAVLKGKKICQIPFVFAFLLLYLFLFLSVHPSCHRPQMGVKRS